MVVGDSLGQPRRDLSTLTHPRRTSPADCNDEVRSIPLGAGVPASVRSALAMAYDGSSHWTTTTRPVPSMWNRRGVYSCGMASAARSAVRRDTAPTVSFGGPRIASVGLFLLHNRGCLPTSTLIGPADPPWHIADLHGRVTFCPDHPGILAVGRGRLLRRLLAGRCRSGWIWALAFSQGYTMPLRPSASVETVARPQRQPRPAEVMAVRFEPSTSRSQIDDEPSQAFAPSQRSKPWSQSAEFPAVIVFTPFAAIYFTVRQSEGAC